MSEISSFFVSFTFLRLLGNQIEGKKGRRSSRFKWFMNEHKHDYDDDNNNEEGTRKNMHVLQ